MIIAIVGAGSSYTPEMIDGLLDWKPEGGLTLRLYDLPQGRERSETICDFGRRMAQMRNSQIKIENIYEPAEALDGCDFVISQFRVGMMQARILDETIPLKYGLIGQETTGAGGFFNAMRTVPAALELAGMMEKYCPDAWMINFTNPAGIVTEAVHRHSSIRCVGLCNVPYNIQTDIARLLDTQPERVFCRIVGLNHLSFVTEVFLDGKPVLRQLIDGGRFDRQIVKNIPKSEGTEELIRMLGMVPSPYLQYFYFERDMLEKQLEEAAGLGTRGQQIQKTEEALFRQYSNPELREKPPELEQRGGAYYSTVAAMLIKGLSGTAPLVTAVNYPGGGAITDLSPESVAELNCHIDKNGVKPIMFGALPVQIKGLICQVKAYEELTIEAAMERSVSKAVLALMNNPLVHGFNNAVRLVEDAYNGKLEL